MLKRLLFLLLLAAWPAFAQVPGTTIQINRTGVVGGTTTQCLYITTARTVGSQACGTGTATDITVGTTTVTGGSNGNILGKAAGVLSVFTTSGSGTVVALQTGAALITPALGVATGTSLALGGATIGSNALAVTGSTQFNGSVAIANSQTFTVGSFGIAIAATGTTGIGLAQATVSTIALSGSAGILGFVPAASNIQAAPDAAFTRTGVGAIGVGTGAFGSTAGALSMTGITVSGTAAVFSGLGSDATHTDATVCVDSSNGTLYKGSGAVGICLGTSSVRYKRDILPQQAGLAEVLKLEPVTYRYLPGYGDGGSKRLYGFTAEQTYGVLPEIVDLDSEGRPNAIDWAALVPILVKAVQQQQARIISLESPGRRTP